MASVDASRVTAIEAVDGRKVRFHFVVSNLPERVQEHALCTQALRVLCLRLSGSYSLVRWASEYAV
jgi:hypothetical protein